VGGSVGGGGLVVGVGGSVGLVVGVGGSVGFAVIVTVGGAVGVGGSVGGGGLGVLVGGSVGGGGLSVAVAVCWAPPPAARPTGPGSKAKPTALNKTAKANNLLNIVVPPRDRQRAGSVAPPAGRR